MRKTIREWRGLRGWTQDELGARADLSRRRVSALERGAGASSVELVALARAFECQPIDLEVPGARPAGRPVLAGRELLSRFRARCDYDPSYGSPAETRLYAARQAYPELMYQLDFERQDQPAWNGFLSQAPADSSLEAVGSLLELRRGAEPCREAPVAVGFDLFPVTERESLRIVGHCTVPALVTRDWLMLLQVTVRTPRRYTMDGLVVVHTPRRVFINLEYDGRGHDPSYDARRTRDLGLVTLRLTEADVLADVPLTERLRALGYCRPRGR